MDIDNNTINEYIKMLDSYDIVIASKYHPRSKVNTPTSRFDIECLVHWI